MKAYALVLLTCLVAAPAAADTALRLSAGQVGIADDLEEPEWYGVELTWATFSRWDLTPGAGYYHAGCGANFAYFDLRKDVWSSERWVLTSSFGPGYFTDSEQIQLGHKVEFRSGLEFAYRLRSGGRVGVGIAHLSNSSLGRLNPGTETLAISYSMPLS